jgi:hypothetical protein
LQHAFPFLNDFIIVFLLCFHGDSLLFLVGGLTPCFTGRKGRRNPNLKFSTIFPARPLRSGASRSLGKIHIFNTLQIICRSFVGTPYYPILYITGILYCHFFHNSLSVNSSTIKYPTFIRLVFPGSNNGLLFIRSAISY